MERKIRYAKLKLKSYLRTKLLGKHATGVIYTTKNGKISAPLDDLSVGKKLGKKGEYDIAEVNLLKTFVKRTDTLYFIGVHWGTLLIPLSKHCKSIVGYEANPKTFSFLETNLFLNGVENTTLFNLAAGDSQRTIKFYQSKINSGGSKMKPKKDSYKYTYDNPDVIDVTMVSLDEHALEQDLTMPNGIIMDIEGAEFYALKGMVNILKQSDFLYIEYVPHHLKNVSDTTNEEFFKLIIPYYNQIKSMRNPSKVFNLSTNRNEFMVYVDELMQNDMADDFLFTNDSSLT